MFSEARFLDQSKIYLQEGSKYYLYMLWNVIFKPVVNERGSSLGGAADAGHRPSLYLMVVKFIFHIEKSTM